MTGLNYQFLSRSEASVWPIQISVQNLIINKYRVDKSKHIQGIYFQINFSDLSKDKFKFTLRVLLKIITTSLQQVSPMLAWSRAVDY